MIASADDLPTPYRLIHLAEADSTNSEAMRLALAGERGPLWVLADRQTMGRGRSGRTWVSSPGNLFASLLIETGCPPARAGQLSLVAGVAAIDAIRGAGQLQSDLRLKWPNDILVGPGKAGGVLVESSARGAARIAVIGVGLNLASAPPGLESGATFLAAHGLPLSPREALCFLARTMDAWLKTWNEGEGFAAIRASWLERAGAIGERLTVQAAEGPVEGRFAGLDDDGALLIATDGGAQRRFTFGDVTLQRGRADSESRKDGDSR
jgi:BirA family transcriptional regulator, biotin operon repressor / biotin---[acetyl-CoA-carboxylase] ligase